MTEDEMAGCITDSIDISLSDNAKVYSRHLISE